MNRVRSKLQLLMVDRNNLEREIKRINKMLVTNTMPPTTRSWSENHVQSMTNSIKKLNGEIDKLK